MCGIFGYFDRTCTPVPDEKLIAMGQVIEHRGPDDHGCFHQDSAAIGNQRLSIIDIAGGHQPFVSDDGQIAVVQNGEIFNYIELATELKAAGNPCRSHSDTEVLLRLYELHGIDFLSKLNGMFAFAILDLRDRQMFIVRDRIGIKPLYLHDDGQRVLFASEIKSILKAGVSPDLDPDALNLFLTYNYAPPPHTFFKGIRHLMPGHFIKITDAGSETHCWWDLPAKSAVVTGRSENDWIEEFNSILEDAVRLRMRCDVPYGAFLSGGVDSSSIVGLMSRNVEEPVRTFCIGFDDPRYDEAPYAQEAADRFHTRHVMERVNPNMLDIWQKVIYHCDQPHGDVSFMPTYRVSELAARHVKVVLTGDGGDELFAGYDKHRQIFSSTGMATDSAADFLKAGRQHLSLFDDERRRLLLSSAVTTQLSEAAWGPLESVLARSEHLGRVNQVLMTDMLLLLPGNNLVKPDRMAMAVSLEARAPFLDYRMMEFAFRTPGDLKLRDGVTKYLYKKAVTPLIGENLAYRKKQMFTVPVGEWFRTVLKSFVGEILLSQKSLERGWFEKDAICHLIDDHTDGLSNNTREIRALIAVELWARIFLDGDNSFESLGAL